MDESAPVDASCATPGCDAPRDFGLTARLLVFLPLLGATLNALGVMRVYRLLARCSTHRRSSNPRNHTAHQITALVVHINRHVLPYQSRCLLESVALWYLLRRHGHAADLVLGVRTLLGPPEGHAWVELDGEPLNDTAHVRDVYVPFHLSAITPEPGSR